MDRLLSQMIAEKRTLISTGEYPAAETAGRLKIVYLFSVSFPLVGNPSDLLGIARKILDKPE